MFIIVLILGIILNKFIVKKYWVLRAETHRAHPGVVDRKIPLDGGYPGYNIGKPDCGP